MPDLKRSSFSMPSKKHILLLVLLAVIFLLALIFLLWPKGTVSKSKNDVKAFSLCLQEKGAIMYGSDTCPECLNQKKVFGDAFENIDYRNCDFQKNECEKLGITSYPVWKNGDKVLPGFQSFSNLAQFSGCSLPTS
jgi:hypothetical protein